MTVDKSCFGNAGKFASFVQADLSGDVSISINMETHQVHSNVPDPEGMCWAYCCLWLKKMQHDKRYMVSASGLPTIDAINLQSDMKSRFSYSDTANALQLALGAAPKDRGTVATLLGPVKNVKDCLDDYARQGCNAVMFTFNGHSQGKPTAHAVVAKLDRSWTGGYLNGSYPCAMFDPNAGQGMYANHEKMASDFLKIVNGYGWVSNIRAQTISTPFN